jgi:DNA repair exonuclease SbcCD ATPase subunit
MNTNFSALTGDALVLGEARQQGIEAAFRAALQRANPAIASAVADLDQVKIRTADARAKLASLTSAIYNKRNRLNTLPRNAGADRERLALELGVLTAAFDEADKIAQFLSDACANAQAALEQVTGG